MKAYVKNGMIIATHDDWQIVAATLYGEGIDIFVVPNTAKPGENIADYPEAQKETAE